MQIKQKVKGNAQYIENRR